MAIKFTGIRHVTHEDDHKREAAFWASKTIAKWVIAGWALAESDLLKQREHEPEKHTAWTLRRV